MKTKKLFLALITCALLVTCNSPYPIDFKKTDWEVFELNGKVKTMKETTTIYVTDENDSIQKGEESLTYSFLENGYISEESLGFDSYNYGYDNKAKLIGKTYRGGLNMRSYIEEIYNDKGDLIDEKIEDYFPDAPAFMADIKVRKTYKYQYNSDGKVAEKEFYSDSLKELRGRVSYKYNAKGQIGETTQQFRDKEDDSKWAAVENWKYEYNDKGFLSRKILNNGQEFYDYEYSYDSQGNYLTQSEYKTTPEKSKTLTKTVERTIEYY